MIHSHLAQACCFFVFCHLGSTPAIEKESFCFKGAVPKDALDIWDALEFKVGVRFSVLRGGFDMAISIL